MSREIPEQCIDVERIGEVLKLPSDHPDRRHADTCPRCASIAASYRDFVTAEGLADSGIEQARPALDAHIRDGAARWSPPGTTSSAARASQWFGFRRPLVLVTSAAVVIAAVALWRMQRPQDDVLRDGAATHAPFALNEAEVRADGSIRLSWTPMPGADQYQVRIYGPEMSEIYRSAATSETMLTIDRSALPARLPPTLDATWQVDALAGGDVIETSAPGSIRTP